MVNAPGEFGQSKVSNLRMSFFCQHYIGWLDVPVDYAFFMGFSETFGDLQSNILGFINVKTTLFKLVL